MTGTDLEEICRIKFLLAASFEMKDLGDLHYFLGIEVIRTPKGILISQRHYVMSMLFRFGMTHCKSVSTPLDRNVKLHPKTVLTDCRKSHLSGHHPAGPQIYGQTDKSVYVATDGRASSVCAKDTPICQRHKR